MFNFICPDLSYLSLIIKLKGDKNMITNEEVSKIIYEEIKLWATCIEVVRPKFNNNVYTDY